MTYLLIGHIIVALSGIISSTLSALMPTRTKLRLSYGLISLTIVSGTVLVVLTHQPLLQSCLSGLAYLAFTAVGTLTSARRLARIQQPVEK